MVSTLFAALTGRHGKAAQLAANEAMRDLMRNYIEQACPALRAARFRAAPLATISRKLLRSPEIFSRACTHKPTLNADLGVLPNVRYWG